MLLVDHPRPRSGRDKFNATSPSITNRKRCLTEQNESFLVVGLVVSDDEGSWLFSIVVRNTTGPRMEEEGNQLKYYGMVFGDSPNRYGYCRVDYVLWVKLYVFRYWILPIPTWKTLYFSLLDLAVSLWLKFTFQTYQLVYYNLFVFVSSIAKISFILFVSCFVKQHPGRSHVLLDIYDCEIL